MSRSYLYRSRTFLRVLVLCERLAPQASDLEDELHGTAWIEGVEALEGILMPVVRTEAIAANFC